MGILSYQSLSWCRLVSMLIGEATIAHGAASCKITGPWMDVDPPGSCNYNCIWSSEWTDTPSWCKDDGYCCWVLHEHQYRELWHVDDNNVVQNSLTITSDVTGTFSKGDGL